MKKLIFILVLFIVIGFFPVISHADNAVIQSIHHYGGSNDEDILDSIQTPDGKIIGVGYTNSGDHDISSNRGNSDFLILKFDTSGTAIWTKTFGGSQEDEFQSVTLLNDGSILAAGYSASSDGDLSNNKGRYDAIIAKFDANGNKIWIKNYGGSYEDFFRTVIATNDGGFVAAGETYSSNGDIVNSHGNDDGFIVKFDANGNQIWMKTVGGSNVDWIQSATISSDNAIIIVGGTQSSNGDFSTHFGGNDVFVAKFDQNGNKIWLKTFGGNDDDDPYRIITTHDGGYAIAGNTFSTNGDFPTTSSPSDAFILKIDQNGNKLWGKTDGGNDWDYFYDVKELTNGNYILAGESYSNDNDFSTNKGGGDGIIAELDSSGNKISIVDIGGSNEDWFQGIISINNVQFLAYGSSYSSDGDLSSNYGGSDIFYVNFSIPVTHQTNVDLSLQTGTFSLSNITPSLNFGNITIDNTSKTLPIHLSDFQITDNRGSLEGWNVTVSASPFISSSNSNYSLGTNVLVLNGIQSITQTIGHSSLPSSINNGTSIDSGAVKILLAANNTGGGTYQIDFPTNTLNLSFDTSKVLMDQTTTAFHSTITWTLNVGP